MSLVVSAGSFCLQVDKGFRISKSKGYKLGLRAALIEARPKVNGLPVVVQVLGGDRAEDLQAEAKAVDVPPMPLFTAPNFLHASIGHDPSSMTNTLKRYQRCCFTPQNNSLERETQSWYQEVTKLKTKYDALQRTQRCLQEGQNARN